MPIVFACISPHPPIILPSVGSPGNRKQVKKTIECLASLKNKLNATKPEKIIISSPHKDWGFNVPLFFLAKNFKGEIANYLMGVEDPKYYFKRGKEFCKEHLKFKIAIVASGDLSHCLKADGPYGFHADGPKFDNALIGALRKKEIETILNLDKIYPGAGECGLRSFCFLLGILEAHSASSGQAWQPEILSYEYPFGVGYLVANFNLQ